MTARSTDMLEDRTLLGKRVDLIREYNIALVAVVTEMLAAGGGESKPLGGGKKDSSVSPNLVSGWAGDLLTQEVKALEYRTKRLHNWVENPRPVKKRRQRRCVECGAGAQRGAKFCAQCGHEIPEQRKETDDGKQPSATDQNSV